MISTEKNRCFPLPFLISSYTSTSDVCMYVCRLPLPLHSHLSPCCIQFLLSISLLLLPVHLFHSVGLLKQCVVVIWDGLQCLHFTLQLAPCVEELRAHTANTQHTHTRRKNRRNQSIRMHKNRYTQLYLNT